MSSHNKHGTRDRRDFYETPQWCVDGLYAALDKDFPPPTLDPCAGTGALCLAARCRGIELDSELEAAARWNGATTVCGDGLRPRWNNQHILMNPPYKEALTWVTKGVEEAETCCALLRLGFLASKRRASFWKAYPPAYVVILSQRPSFVYSGKCDSADYAWVVWKKPPLQIDNHSIFKLREQGTRMRWISK